LRTASEGALAIYVYGVLGEIIREKSLPFWRFFWF
jgi:hypothetical protein